MILEEFVACKIFTRKLLGRILRTHVEAHLTYMRVSLNGIQVKTSRVRDNLPWATGMQQERILSRGGIVDTKTIWIAFLLILPCWRVFFLGRPALHCVGTNRPQMVGVCSLHVDCVWLLASSFRPGLLSSVLQQCSICSSLGHGFKPR